tara:strand:- start:742 stop:1104 length:363 start_codon:yes stop_codon:yes gene_type:complete
MADHKFVSIPAREVVPYRYGVLYSFDGGAGHRVEGDRPDHFVNQIVRIKWSEDGEHLWFGLDSHNTMKVRPDESARSVGGELFGKNARIVRCIFCDDFQWLNGVDLDDAKHDCKQLEGNS